VTVKTHILQRQEFPENTISSCSDYTQKVSNIFHAMSTTKTQLFEFLYETCQQNDGVLVDTLHNYIASLDEVELCELEDFLVNNFGDD